MKKKKISFIGISNWSLDSSKMNRAINIVVEQPNVDDIIETAKEIAKNIDEVIEKRSEKLIVSISKAYNDYISNFQLQQGNEDFHGFRDFYYLIKYIFYNILEYYSKNNEEFNTDNYITYVIKGIIKNFDGNKNSIEKMKAKFFEYYYDKNEIDEKKAKININYNVIDFIYENINSEIDSRYLLLIGKNEINEYLLKIILKGKRYDILSFNDLNKYDNENKNILHLLLHIQLLMEQEIILVLKDLEILYPSLYDLFNKNFTTYGNSNKFAKISFENKQSLLYVNDNFRIIVLVEENNLDYEDKPFLNRFEKHILLIDNLLDSKSLKIANDIYQSLNNLTKFEKNNEVINLKEYLIDISLEKIKILLFEMMKISIENIENIVSK